MVTTTVVGVPNRVNRLRIAAHTCSSAHGRPVRNARHAQPVQSRPPRRLPARQLHQDFAGLRNCPGISCRERRMTMLINHPFSEIRASDSAMLTRHDNLPSMRPPIHVRCSSPTRH
jgi:hypothetical protein